MSGARKIYCYSGMVLGVLVVGWFVGRIVEGDLLPMVCFGFWAGWVGFTVGDLKFKAEQSYDNLLDALLSDDFGGTGSRAVPEWRRLNFALFIVPIAPGFLLMHHLNSVEIKSELLREQRRAEALVEEGARKAAESRLEAERSAQQRNKAEQVARVAQAEEEARKAAPAKALAIQMDAAQERAALFWLQRATNGDAFAQLEVGLRYLSGKGVPVDKDLALHWLKAAAAQGDAKAKAELSKLGIQ